MKLFVGVTDNNWYNFLAKRQPDELNFWRPNAKQAFRAIAANDLFLFKLHHPFNYIVGGGFFVRYSMLPLSLAWETFEQNNGAVDYFRFANAIYKYRDSDRRSEPDPAIGCIILSTPFFFAERDWIPIPSDWHLNIVQGKTYDTNTTIGSQLYQQVQERLARNNSSLPGDFISREANGERYGQPQIIQPRLGQGAFKVIVTEAYNRRCAVSGEKTLPVLEAAHIKPYSQEGPHSLRNGLLLRRDLHTLFDRGYFTVNDDLIVEVSKRLKEDYGNGRDYYAFHGKKLTVLPSNLADCPNRQFLEWHNNNVFLA